MCRQLCVAAANLCTAAESSHTPPLVPVLPLRDCWSVAIGNSHNDDERCVLAGYDNGDVKLFDLRTNKVRPGCIWWRGQTHPLPPCVSCATLC